MKSIEINGLSNSAICNIALMGWKNCEVNLLSFKAFRAKYTNSFICKKIRRIESLGLVGRLIGNSESAESNRVKLEKQARVCLRFWQNLREFIFEAFPSSLHISKLEEAGKFYYNNAANNNMNACDQLFTLGFNFMNDHVPELSSDNNMPASFRSTFEEQILIFKDLQSSYNLACIKEKDMLGESDKIMISIIRDLNLMCKDANIIFSDRTRFLRKFMFSEMKTTIINSRLNKVYGRVFLYGEDYNPVPGALVKLSNGEECLTAEDGSFLITPSIKGHYTIKVQCEGYNSETIIDVKSQINLVKMLDIQIIAKENKKQFTKVPEIVYLKS